MFFSSYSAPLQWRRGSFIRNSLWNCCKGWKSVSIINSPALCSQIVQPEAIPALDVVQKLWRCCTRKISIQARPSATLNFWWKIFLRNKFDSEGHTRGSTATVISLRSLMHNQITRPHKHSWLHEASFLVRRPAPSVVRRTQLSFKAARWRGAIKFGFQIEPKVPMSVAIVVNCCVISIKERDESI